VTITGSTTYTANPLNQYTAITGNPAPTYDADGNLLSGLRSPLSVFTCTWNGENRMLSSTSANVAIADRRVENAYDALGRRVRKTVKFASTGAVIEDRYFIYDGWNVIEETIAPATGPVETAEHVWGADLSGTAQGAGGVGGLLLRESSANGASYYHYDGNGNVTALTSGAGTVQAAYTYGPFGETLRAAGPLAQANPWRFSTKYQDDETGLLYYGYRFYNPTDGRWPSRDPIEEAGGRNLNSFTFNEPCNFFDILGREPFKLSGPLKNEKFGNGETFNPLDPDPKKPRPDFSVPTIRLDIEERDCECTAGWKMMVWKEGSPSIVINFFAVEGGGNGWHEEAHAWGYLDTFRRARNEIINDKFLNKCYSGQKFVEAKFAIQALQQWVPSHSNYLNIALHLREHPVFGALYPVYAKNDPRLPSDDDLKAAKAKADFLLAEFHKYHERFKALR
jgi:RHS repeat-associated protein